MRERIVTILLRVNEGHGNHPSARTRIVPSAMNVMSVPHLATMRAALAFER